MKKPCREPPLHITNGIRSAACSAARGYVRLGRLRLPRLTSPTFLRLLETYGFLYRNRKNVVYLERYVKCGLNLFGKYTIIYNVKVKTKYFGDIFPSKYYNEIVILTSINVTGKKQEISVLLNIETSLKVINRCVSILDDYLKIFEKGKIILETEFYKNSEMENFIQIMYEKYGEEKFKEIFRIRKYEGKKIKELIKKLDGPNISIEIKKGKENIYLVYGLSKEIDEMVVIKMNRKYEMEEMGYYD